MNTPISKRNDSRWSAVKFGGISAKSRAAFAGFAVMLNRALRPAALVLAAGLALDGGRVQAQVTLSLVNNFAEANGGLYFGGHIEDQDISLYFSGIGANDVTYNGGTSVTEGSRIQLSTVTGGNFNLSGNINAARVYAILGSSAPATIPLPSGPDPVLASYAYSFIELTTQSGGKADQSFLNQVSFPTSLSNGSKTNSWSPGSTAQGVATAFSTAFPLAPYAPAAGVAPNSGTPYAPYAPITVTRSAGSVQSPINAHRVVAASNVNLPAASPPPNPMGTGYTNVPGFNNYLGWLQDNQSGAGWKFGYNAPGFPNSTYVGYLKVTGATDNYGIELGDFTYGGTFDSEGNITGGTAVDGTITYASNNSTQQVYGVPFTGNWTDMLLFGATDPTGTAVTTSGNLGSLDVASVLYTISASIGPGILGSDAYLANDENTDVFFKTGLTSTNALTDFFANSEFGGSTQAGFYDQYWHSMLAAGGVSNGGYAGYFTPYDDHFVGLDVLMDSDSGTLTWELGVVPEPSSIALLTVSLGLLGGSFRRRSRQGGKN